MKLRDLTENGILDNSTQINVNDEWFGTFFCVEFSEDRGQDELVIGFADRCNMNFPLDSEIEINGLDVNVLDEMRTPFTLSFEKTASVDPENYARP